MTLDQTNLGGRGGGGGGGGGGEGRKRNERSLSTIYRDRWSVFVGPRIICSTKATRGY